ncbi:MAG: methionine--tRNA ligase [Anaerolineae bacterium]|nr:methionine--tRNA ligase [Anaerolineae bacterium]
MSEFIHVSVAWPYANGDMHIGHLAGAYLPADIFARYHRLKGNHVLMVSGSDSHGTPISVEADKQGITPRELFEKYHYRFLTTQRDIGISYTLFTHTDTENHYRVSQDIFTILLERGYLFKQSQQQLYSEAAQQFLPDRLVEGTCYICGFEDARGDQCDNCGTLMDATRLINPRSKLDGSAPVVRETEHYFLDLPGLAANLQDYLKRCEQSGRWRTNVLSFSRNYAENLQARAITRDLLWGIPVPLDDFSDKRLYVWFEAVIGYLSASVEWAKNIGQPDAWKDWWYNPEARMYYFIGKDNIPFHTIIWPAELTGISGIYNEGSDQPINLPYDVPANEFMNIEGRQFSKSRNWAIWLPDILERYQPDAIRYYITQTMPETRDSDYSWDGFFSRVNNELVAAWGNLVNRMLGFANKRFEGVIPQPGELNDEDKAILAQSVAVLASVGDLLDAVKLRSALQEAMRVVQEANIYLDHRAPWTLIKTDPQEAATVVYTILRVIDNLKIALAPFLPFSAQQLHEMLGYEGQLFGEMKIETYTESERSHQALVYDGSQAMGAWEPSNLPAGQKFGPISPLFNKLDDTIIDEERARLGAERTV